ncbi:MAG: S8 family serine peptidase, partial [Gammaproteobacteria bacterium]|nr:S8 family serine peptidase [Gammaproteobacteria bacterium]
MAYMLGATDSRYMVGCTGDDCYTGSDGSLANIRESTQSVYPDGITFLNRRIQGGTRVTDRRVTLGVEVSVPPAPQDVRQVWRQGWTGEGVNVLLVDDFGPSPRPDVTARWVGLDGYTAWMSAFETAPQATYYALESGINGDPDYGNRYGNNGVRTHDGTAASASARFHVVNLGFDNSQTPGGGTPSSFWLDGEFEDAYFDDLLSDRLKDAVITRPAGDISVGDTLLGRNNKDTGSYVDLVALATHRSTSPRTLIVGALDGYARTTDPQNQPNVRTNADITSNSRNAGSNEHIQHRFLVEYGGTPYGEAAYLCNSDTPVRDMDGDARCGSRQPVINWELINCFGAEPVGVGTCRSERRYPPGTSFAAPRVAGFAALVRDKFPNLSGAHTA